MSTRLLGRPTGTSPIVSARHSSFPRAWSPNEARWEPRRGVIPELLLDRTAFWGRQQPVSLDKTLIARGHRPTPEPPKRRCHSNVGRVIGRLIQMGVRFSRRRKRDACHDLAMSEFAGDPEEH